MHIFPNGKKYIGITSRRPKARWGNGKNYHKETQSAMYHAIQKYGWENVEHKILYTDLTHDEACQKEQELIALYKTNCCKYGKKYGYNMTDGGEGVSGHPVSEKRRQWQRELCLSKDSPLYNAREVVCDGIHYNSLEEFMRKNNVKGVVREWLKGTRGMPVEWYEKDLHYVDGDSSVIYCQKKPWNYKIEYDGKIFNSQRALAKHLNISPSVICKWIQKGIAEEKGIRRIEQ